MPRIQYFRFAAVAVGLIVAGSWNQASSETTSDAAAKPKLIADDVDRSPVDLVLTPDEKFLITANQTSASVSLVEVATGRVVQEVPCGEHPAAIAMLPDGKRVLVS